MQKVLAAILGETAQPSGTPLSIGGVYPKRGRNQGLLGAVFLSESEWSIDENWIFLDS